MSAISTVSGRCAVFAVLLALNACSAAPVRYYTLLGPAGNPAAADGPAAFAIDVRRVHVPLQVDQPELVVRQGSGEMMLAEKRHWSAPLGEEVRSALAAALAQRLAAPDVTQVSAAKGLPVYQLAVDVQRFDAWLAHQVIVEAVWTVSIGKGARAPADIRSWTCTSRVEQTVDAGYEPLVLGAQQAVVQLAAEISLLIRAAEDRPGTAHCPGS